MVGLLKLISIGDSENLHRLWDGSAVAQLVYYSNGPAIVYSYDDLLHNSIMSGIQKTNKLKFLTR